MSAVGEWVGGDGGGCARDIESLDDLHGRDGNHAKDASRAQTERVQNGEPADEGAKARRIGAAHVAAKRSAGRDVCDVGCRHEMR